MYGVPGYKVRYNYFDWSDPSTIGHIFRPASGHINATTRQAQMRWVPIFEQVCNNEKNFSHWKHVVKDGEFGPIDVKMYYAIVHGFEIWVEVNWRTHAIHDARRNALPGGR